MKPRLSKSEIDKRLYDIHKGVVFSDHSTFKSVNVKSRLVDVVHGEFWCKLNDVFSKKVGHPQRQLEKTKQTWAKKYGVENISQSPSIKRKKISTCIKNFGYEFSTQSPEVQLKIKANNYQKYGFESPNQSPVVKEKKKKVYLEKYGVAAPSQNKEIALKQAKSVNYSFIKYHWKTNEELVCQGSYEVKTVNYLNENQIEFEWQPRVFKMPNGKTYRPDLYLVDENKWIEIKGYMRKDAQEKWDWFKTQFPGAELWNKEKLKHMGIL
jgi:hypothetical protein